MAYRTLKATTTGTASIFQNGQGVSYDESLSFGTKVSNSHVTSGTIKITNFRAMYTGSMYLEIYINGSKACRSSSFTFGEDYDTLSVSIYTSSGLNSSVLLTSSASAISVYVRSSSAGSTEYIWGLDSESTVTITANHALSYSKCSAPTKVEVSTASAAPNADVTLSWSGASKGTNVSIKGYHIYRATSADETYTKWQTIDSTATSGSYTVKPPTENGTSYYYKVQTIGSKDGYDSGVSSAYATLTCDYASVGAPTVVTLVATNAAPGGGVELRWDKASAGTNNPIRGYQVWQATSSDGEYTPVGDPVETTEVSGSQMVYAPETNFDSYYFKVQTLGTLEGTDSEQSSVYATLTCTYSSPSAPTTVTVNGSTYVYVLPGNKVVLEWSIAADGANNPVTGYSIFRDDEVVVTSLEATITSYEVDANDTAGKSYAYTIVAKGVFGSSAPSVAAIVYSYTDPTAPTDITASGEAPSTGSRVSISWSGAEVGGYNDIISYRVYRSEEVNGNYILVANVVSTDTSASCFVDAHPLVGFSYYFRVETVGSYSGSGMSETYLVLTSGEATAPDSDVTVIITPKPPSAMRKMVFGDYDTDIDGQWILREWTFPEPEEQTNYVNVPGRAAGPIDMSTALTGGDPRYNRRELTARFECCEGTHLDRNETISVMVNRLNGQRMDIVLPDDPTHYITGRLRVRKDFNNMAYASVSVSAVCEPWRYSKHETLVEVLAVEVNREIVLSNTGRRIVSPEITVSGLNAKVYLTFGATVQELTSGTHKISGLTLKTGNTPIMVRGAGTVTFKYREAIL